jgi:ElaB/YqjD/DUF883 family membrane-anchored ribosome-binding protein
MNTTQNNDLRMPSGSEVESAAFHVHGPSCGCSIVSTPVHTTSSPMSSSSGMKEKLNQLKSQGRMKLHDMQHVIDDKTTVMKSSLQRSMALAKTNVRNSMMTAKTTMNRSMDQANTSLQTGLSDIQSDMKVNPMKWAGIAAGSGFAIGLLGRFMHWRNKHRHVHGMPQLVIIESAC